ncbi:MAG: ATP-dependent Clp protease ATP-binding subunit, partial [Clostridia bacterium]|nr:ATP-dependent Clp protease ATP-binding subunit [Clostridia bacterium]
MKQNFSDEARRALENASSAAAELGQQYIGSEHLLLGLLLEEDSAAGEILAQQGLTFDAAKEKLTQLCDTGEPIRPETMEVTPRAQRILQAAGYEAAKAHGETGTEHLLLALVSDTDSLGVRIMQLLGADLNAVYKACRASIREADAPAEGGKKKKSRGLKNVEKYGHDLTEDAREGRLDPIIGRETELERVIQILSRRTKNNPCLIGVTGVG